MLTDAFHVTERERHLWVICGLIGRLGIFVMFVYIHALKVGTGTCISGACVNVLTLHMSIHQSGRE